MELPKKILSADGKTEGVPTGGTRPCRVEGCTGQRVATRWPDKKVTWPCSKGMDAAGKDVWRIVPVGTL